jgi:hypothetical protein
MQGRPVAAQMLFWKMRGHLVRLAVPFARLAEQSDADKLAIHDFSLQHNATLGEAAAPVSGNNAHALAMVGGEAIAAASGRRARRRRDRRGRHGDDGASQFTAVDGHAAAAGQSAILRDWLRPQ